MNRDFWRSAGLHLVERNAGGWLAVTDQFMRAYWTRPEVHPIEESNRHERELHEALLDAPFLPVSDADLAGLADPDAIETYRCVLAFREVLQQAGTIEAAYLKLVRGMRTSAPIPPVFYDQMVHLILRNALDGTADPMRLRAGEIFFREQLVSTEEGRLMLADEEIVGMQAQSAQTGLAQLLSETGTRPRSAALEGLDEDSSATYWSRSDRFDTVVDFRFEHPALDAFARVIEVWIVHLLGLEVRVEPRPKLEDRDWRWHIGLDAEATRLLNALYEGREVGIDEVSRLVGLFRLWIADDAQVIDQVKGRPVYLGLAMDAAKRVRMKPQNLLVNLPLLRAS